MQQHHQQHQHQQQQLPFGAHAPLSPPPPHRLEQQAAYRGAAKRVRHPLPPELQDALAVAAARPPREPAPPLVSSSTDGADGAAAAQPQRGMLFSSRRAGAVAVKAGMTQEWDEFGARVPLTVLWLDGCVVVRHLTAAADGVDALVLGAGARREKALHPRQRGELLAHGAPPVRKLWQCRVTPDALLPPGTEITAAHFVAGQYLDVSGTTKGKGFAGGMKRWGFSGQGASHGNTKSHRRIGSIGGRGDPARVFPGKKMPGRMGGDRRTVKNVWVYKVRACGVFRGCVSCWTVWLGLGEEPWGRWNNRMETSATHPRPKQHETTQTQTHKHATRYQVDAARNLVYVRGQVPGPAGSYVLLRDAFRWPWAERAACALPFPTAAPGASAAGADGAGAGVTVARRDRPDPFARYRSDVNEYLEGATWKTE